MELSANNTLALVDDEGAINDGTSVAKRDAGADKNFFIDNGNLESIISTWEKLPISILYVGADEMIKGINQTYCDFLDVRREDAIGKHIYEVVPNSRIPIVLNTGEAEIAWHHKLVNGPEGIVHRIPIKENGQIIGCLAMIIFKNLRELFDVVESNKKLEAELNRYKNQLKLVCGAKYTCSDIIGTSPVMKVCKDMIVKMAKSNSTVLIRGESGVGKELVAHAIHSASPRKDHPLIRVNCAAIPEPLLESELFGYEEGAFSGAKRGGKLGKIELSNGGTIFLDEIGDMPLTMQAKILRLLQEKEFEKVGGKGSTPANVRVIAATNKNLEKMLEEGLFREDLYYRLNVLCVNMPSLRDRRGDIPLLVRHILSVLFEETGIFKMITDEAMDVLRAYDWPGNVRELRNTLERIVITQEVDTITADSLPDHLQVCAESPSAPVVFGDLNSVSMQAERAVIRKALELTAGNITEAAKILKISRPRLYRKKQLYEL